MNKSIKTRVRESLRDALSLCRLRAIARLSQLESAKEDSLKLLPRIFSKAVSEECSLESVAGSSIGLKFIMEIEEHSAKNILLRLSVLFLESTGCYHEVIRVCDSIIRVTSPAPSWVLSCRGWAWLSILVQIERKKIFSAGVCQPDNMYSLRNILLGREGVAVAIGVLESALAAEAVQCYEVSAILW